MEQENLTQQDNQAQVVEQDAEVVINTGETKEAETPKGWFDGLPPDLKSNPSITKFKTEADLAKSYVELQKMIGKEKIVIPTEKSTPEEWQAFWNKVGRPNDMTGYETPNLEMPEEVKMRQENLEAFKKKAHDLGLTKKQFAELFGMYSEMNLNSYNQELSKAKTMAQETETKLRGEYGAAYEAKIDGAQKVINKFFKGKEIHPAFKVLANDIGFVKSMAEIAEQLGEDAIAGSPRMTLTPQEAQRELNAMIADPKHPYNQELHPEHKAAVERSIELQTMALAGQ